MRAYIPGYDLRVPGSLRETLGLLAGEPGIWQPFAGGTDLMVLLEAGKLSHKRFLSLSRLADLRGIAVTSDSVILGALTTYTEIQRSSVLQSEFPLLCAAARETGGIATQNRGTLGGNIVNASPAADSPPALLVYDAEIELISVRGTHWLPYHGFHTGYKKMQLAPDELLRAIRLPRRAKPWRQYYRKVGTRKAQAISKVCFAGAHKWKPARFATFALQSQHCAHRAAHCENGRCVAGRAARAWDNCESQRNSCPRNFSN